MKMPEEERAVFAEAYRFYEECRELPDTVEGWMTRVEKMKDAVEKHGRSNLAQHLILGCYEAMDADARAARKAIGL